jgi:hypothetical protein
LLEGGANPNAKAPDGNTMVHLAAAASNLDMLRALKKHGANFDEPNNDKLTALDIAEGKQPEGGARGRGARGGRGGGAPPAGGRGRGAAGGVTREQVAAELRTLMGLPPAPPAPPAAAAPAADAIPPTPGAEAQQ